MDDERVNVVLNAKTINELKVKIKRYLYSYDKKLYESEVGEIYEENKAFKVVINRLK
jgi:hypothetical protein